MPELPDVEGFRRALAEQLPGRRVRRVEVMDAGVLRNSTSASLGRGLHRRRFARPRRIGKWLILPTDGPTLLIHSGMTGHVYCGSTKDPDGRHDRLVIHLDRGELRYADQRKLRGIWLAAGNENIEEIIGRHGPDALTVRPEEFTDALCGKRGQLKPALLDQRVVAGLGNLLVDEICWQAKLNPAHTVAHLGPADVRALHTAMRRTLRTAVRHGCVPGLRGWLTRVRDESEAQCPRCHTPLARGRRGGRSTVWCPRCQPD